jgi:hypothetical protein
MLNATFDKHSCVAFGGPKPSRQSQPKHGRVGVSSHDLWLISRQWNGFEQEALLFFQT